jgi:hypothetical protein
MTATHHRFDVEVIVEDVRTEVRDSRPGIADQFYHGSGKGHCHSIVKREYCLRSVSWLLPSLAGSVDMPRACHSHVRMQRQAALESHDQVLTGWLDRQQFPPFQTTNHFRPRSYHGLARQPLAESHGCAPDRVPFRHGRLPL